MVVEARPLEPVLVERLVVLAARHRPLDEGREAQRRLVAEAQPAAEVGVVAIALIDHRAARRAVLVERSVERALEREDLAPEGAVKRRRACELVDPGTVVDAGGEVRVGDALLRIGVAAGKGDVPAGLEIDAPGGVDRSGRRTGGVARQALFVGATQRQRRLVAAPSPTAGAVPASRSAWWTGRRPNRWWRGRVSSSATDRG